MDTSIVSKENAKQQIKELIEKYNNVVKEQRVNKYNEEMTKKDFILPLFRALGWDVENSNEVSAEEKISKKRVDYGFRINGIPKFFLEAKPLKADLNLEEYAIQAINYAWHKGCTWAVLTDFEEVKVFNAELKTEFPLQNVFFSLNCERFLENFEQLWLLSRDSFEQGLLDKEAEKWGKKLKKTSVDKQLLMDFTNFRELLSKNIMKLNLSKKLTEEQLDEAVQRILDRLIFIRNCEDRELESKILISKLREWDSKGRGLLIKYLRESFEYFDKEYNSKLFQEHLCDSLEIDSEVLSEIINGLYYTKEGMVSYDFSAIEADVLGNIYEQYLGHVLKKTEKRAKVTENHVHRKEQGIYYTPTYIVDYIVRNTLGELLKDKKVNAEKIRVLDPACGSGSFLIKAFDVLNEYYSKKGDYEQTKFDTSGGGMGVTFTKKVEILKNNIFGVDLDSKAVEIAQLNLLLKIAEKSQRLPLLQENIKCGNSLIDDPTVAEDKAFKWEEQFKEIIQDGGFDVVIGNPPYVRQEELTTLMKRAFEKYEVFDASAYLYTYFFERGLELLKDGGLFSFIVSSKFIKTRYGKSLRKFILNNSRIRQFIDFRDLPVFKEATTYPCIIILEKSSNLDKNNQNRILVSKIASLDYGNLNNTVKSNSFEFEQRFLTEAPWSLERPRLNLLMKKIERSGTPLRNFIGDKLYRGVTTSCNEAFIIDENTKNELIEKDPKSKEIIRKFLTGKDIKRYSTNFENRYLIFSYTNIDIDRYPAVKQHLLKFKDMLDKVWEVKRKKHVWYELRGCSYYDKFEASKIIYPRINIEPNFTLDDEGYFVQDSSFLIPSSSRFLLGILNSKLIKFYAERICSLLRGGYYDYRYQYVELFPIAEPTKSTDINIKQLVDKMLSLNKRLNEIGDKKTDERAKMEEEIKKTDAEIDELVYEIYGITEEEKKIIEESLK